MTAFPNQILQRKLNLLPMVWDEPPFPDGHLPTDARHYISNLVLIRKLFNRVFGMTFRITNS